MNHTELLSNAKPILFNTSMVKAMLEGRKCCTRRLCTPQPVFRNGETGVFVEMDDGSFQLKVDGYKSIYDYPTYSKYFVGDILYVRETWAEDKNVYFYKADFSDDDLQKIANITRWRPSIHMPKVASRIFLRVTNVRLERLQEITEEDAVKEGVFFCDELFSGYHWGEHEIGHVWDSARNAFLWGLWNSTVPTSDKDIYGWQANPWVWVYEFELVEKEG